MASILGMVKRLRKTINPPVVQKESNTLRFGILGAAAIAPTALIQPAQNHPEVLIYAVAARSLERAQKFSKQYGIEKAYGSYQELLKDPEVDVVYNPLPNALHYEWTMKALAAGKHVLNEKPSADTVEETRAMFEFAESKGLVLLDAFHYRHHPALAKFKQIVDSGEIGKLKHVTAVMELGGIFGDDNIRFNYDLGGGALMDLGCYCMSAIQFTSSSVPVSVVAATHKAFVPKNADPSYVKNVDTQVVAELAFPSSDLTATVSMDLCKPSFLGFIPKIPVIKLVAEGELGSVIFFNHVLPTFYHSITVKNNGGSTRVIKVYKSTEGRLKDKDAEWWTTYRYQLEAFVDKVKGREPVTWVSKEESVSIMESVVKVYDKIGLGARPKSTYVPA